MINRLRVAILTHIGLLKFAVYGGRIDNTFDFRVLEV